MARLDGTPIARPRGSDRRELSRIVDTVPEVSYEPLTAALRQLADTAGELPDSEWWLGWHEGDAERHP